MARQRVVVFRGTQVIHTQEDMQGNSTEYGVLAVAGKTSAVVFASGQWTHVTIELIED